MLGATSFLNGFIEDEVKCRGLSMEDFGAEIDNEKNDVPLYDMYNRGLSACEEGMERKNLKTEGQRTGLTGYIPSMEQAMRDYPATSVRPKTILLALGSPNSKTGK